MFSNCHNTVKYFSSSNVLNLMKRFTACLKFRSLDNERSAITNKDINRSAQFFFATHTHFND